MVSAAVSSYAPAAYNKERHFTLLVIDRPDTNWEAIFRGRKIHADCDIRLEQATTQLR